MDSVDLKALLNEKFGEMYQLMLAGDPAMANAVMDELVSEITQGGTK